MSCRSPPAFTLWKRRRECLWGPCLCRASSSLSLAFSTCEEEPASEASGSWLNIQFFQTTESLCRRRRLMWTAFVESRGERKRVCVGSRSLTHSRAAVRPQLPVGNRKYTNILCELKQHEPLKRLSTLVRVHLKSGVFV